MSLRTYSKFYFGITIDSSNNIIDFQESAGVLFATLNAGSYTLTDFATEVARALNSAGLLVYSCTLDRATRKLTISTPATNFKLLTTTGLHIGVTAFPTLGYSGADKTGAHTYTAGAAIGTEYKPQFTLQSYISPAQWKEAISPTINESSSGLIEVVKFGDRNFLQFEINFITDIPQPSKSYLRNDPLAFENIQTFMTFLITKAPLEFMPNENDVATFIKCLCEETEMSQTGTGFQIQEMYDQDLAGYFKTGIIKMRVVS